jgi:hypothetical protein
MFRASSCPSSGEWYKDAEKMMYLLLSHHVSGIIMPIIRRTVQRCRKDDVFIGVSTYFGQHHAHH